MFQGGASYRKVVVTNASECECTLDIGVVFAKAVVDNAIKAILSARDRHHSASRRAGELQCPVKFAVAVQQGMPHFHEYVLPPYHA